MSDLLDRAVEAMRDEPIAEDDWTLMRIRSSLARGERSRNGVWVAAAAALIAVALGGPTAWAWATEHITQWLGADDVPKAALPPPSPRGAALPRTYGTRTATTTVEPAPSETPTASAGTAAAVPRAHRAPVSIHAASGPASLSVAEDEETLEFQDAHHVHFELRDFAAALEAWSRYLGDYPEGRYVPEARYNRALALVHLGRLREARVALARFADQEPGAYRQAEAAALVRALDDRLSSTER